MIKFAKVANWLIKYGRGPKSVGSSGELCKFGFPNLVNIIPSKILGVKFFFLWLHKVVK